GADLLCLGADIDAGIVESVAAEVAAAVADGRLGLGRLEEAAGRVAELAAWAAPGQRSAEVDPGIGYDAARRAVRVEGAVGTTGARGLLRTYGASHANARAAAEALGLLEPVHGG